jgi:hypothetical protein
LAEVEHALELLEDAGLASNDLLSRAGRWSALDAAASGQPLEAYAEALLQRYGIICRDIVRAERGPFGWRELERLLRLWEWRGRAIRGDFVRDFSGPQFARAEAVDQLREAAPGPRPLLLAWDDPANAWGRLLRCPAPRGKGRFVMLLEGQPILTGAGWGRDLQPGPAWQPAHIPAAAQALRDLALWTPAGAALERWAGGSILVSPLAAALREAGWTRAGLRLVARRRPAALELDPAV